MDLVLGYLAEKEFQSGDSSGWRVAHFTLSSLSSFRSDAAGRTGYAEGEG